MKKRGYSVFKKNISFIVCSLALLSLSHLSGQASDLAYDAALPMPVSGSMHVAPDNGAVGVIDSAIGSLSNFAGTVAQSFDSGLQTINAGLQGALHTLPDAVAECVPGALVGSAFIPNNQGNNPRRFWLIPVFISGCMANKFYKKMSELLIARVYGKNALDDTMFSEKSLARAMQTAAYVATGWLVPGLVGRAFADREFVGDGEMQFSSVPKIEVLLMAWNFWGDLLHESNTTQVDKIIEGGAVSYAAYKIARFVASGLPNSDHLGGEAVKKLITIERESIKKFMTYFLPSLYWDALYSRLSAEEREHSLLPFRVGVFSEIALVAVLPFIFRRLRAQQGA